MAETERRVTLRGLTPREWLVTSRAGMVGYHGGIWYVFLSNEAGVTYKLNMTAFMQKNPEFSVALKKAARPYTTVHAHKTENPRPLLGNIELFYKPTPLSKPKLVGFQINGEPNLKSKEEKKVSEELLNSIPCYGIFLAKPI